MHRSGHREAGSATTASVPAAARAGRSAPSHAILRLQRQAGNGAVTRLLQAARRGDARWVAVQRLHGAVPAGFQVVASTKDDVECKVFSTHAWVSSTGNAADLSDVQVREKVDFATDPRVDMPAYNNPPPGVVLAGNTVTRTGPAQGCGGVDTHSGAAHGTAFTWGPHQNLRKAAWTLVATQVYQYKTAGGAWTDMHNPAYTLTRTMAQDGNGQWQLTFHKQGPGENTTAGPTNIYDVPTTEALHALSVAKPDQTADWQAALAELNNMGLTLKASGRDKLKANNAAKTPINVSYSYTVPTAVPKPQRAFYRLTSSQVSAIKKQALTGTKLVKEVLDGPTPPTRIEFVIAKNSANVRQQAWWTNENGGTYRVLLRADVILNTAAHIGASVTGDLSSAAGALKAKPKDKIAEQIRCYAKGAAVHELGHMLHARSSPAKFMGSTLLAPLPPPPVGAAPDPNRPHKEQVATINLQVKNRLGAQGYPGRWGYAIGNGNPSEVVAEVFAALVQTDANQVAADIPRGLAAVYLAYGGHRSADIDAKLARIFPAGVPALSQPQDALAHI